MSAHDLGLVVGVSPTGELNAFTDVDGVRVGHHTVIEGDYVIAFSTHPDVRRPRESDMPVHTTSLVDASISPLFAATAEATEEAIYNAILRATTVTIERGTLEAISIEEILRRILEEYNVLEWDDSTAPGGN